MIQTPLSEKLDYVQGLHQLVLNKYLTGEKSVKNDFEFMEIDQERIYMIYMEIRLHILPTQWPLLLFHFAHKKVASIYLAYFRLLL